MIERKMAVEWLNLICDDWSGVCSNDLTVQHPSWSQIEAAINGLDGERKTCLSFCAKDGREIIIGGGPEKFVVSVAFSDEGIYTLKDSTKPKNEVPLSIGGQTGIYIQQEIWERLVAIEAARYFYAHGQTHPALPWMKVGEGG